MNRSTAWTTVGLALSWMCAATAGGPAQEPRPAAVLQIHSAERLSAGRLRVVNREVTAIQRPRGVHLSERQGTGIAWIEGSEFGHGTIEPTFVVETCSSKVSSASLFIDAMTAPTKPCISDRSTFALPIR